MKSKNMKKVILIITVLIANISFAQTSLYKVTKDGNKMYVGGTIHMLRTTDFPLPSQFDEALAESDVLVLEANAAKLMEPEMAGKLMSAMVFKNGKTLKTVLKPKTLKKLNNKAVSLGFPLDKMMQFKPAMVVVAIQAVELKKIGLAEQGVDIYLTKKANELKKPQEFLESIDFQLNMLVTMGQGYENEFVNYSLKTMKKSVEQLPLMIKEWKQGDKKLVLKTLKEFKKEDPIVYKNLLVDRNNNWIPKLTNYLKDDKIEFVAVGLAHLFGETGILTQLEAKGCKVEQVK